MENILIQQKIFSFIIDNFESCDGKVLKTKHHCWPIKSGIVRFREDDGYNRSFAKQWKIFKEDQYDHKTSLPITRNRYLNGTGWPQNGLQGELILEAGCGAGRFTRVLGETGAAVLSIDYSSAIEVSYEQNRHLKNIAFAQADILDLPFLDNSFDRVFCHGVLQHTENPKKAFLELNRILRKGGNLSFDIYHRDGSIRPWKSKYLWRPITTRLNADTLLKFLNWFIPCWLPTDTKIKKIPFFGKYLGSIVPCWNYCHTGLSNEEKVRWAVMDTFDALAPTFDFPATKSEIVSWFKDAGYKNYLVCEGGNGLIGNGQKP